MTYLQMGLPDIVKEYFSTVLMMYVVCLVGFFPGSLDIWLTMLLVGRWADAHIVPVIVQPVLEHVDRS